MPERFTDDPFAHETQRLMAERGVTLRGLAAVAGVDKGYLSRALRGIEKPSLDLVSRIAEAFELPADYFHEYRAAVMLDVFDLNPDFTRELYDQLENANKITVEPRRRGRSRQPRPGQPRSKPARPDK